MKLLNYKIFKKFLPYIIENVDETSSRILTEFYKNREFKKLKRKHISIKMTIKLIKFAYLELKLLFK
jgi:hypothetical protein